MTVVKTHYTDNGYQHRVHRSIKGRKKFNKRQCFKPSAKVKKEKENSKLESENVNRIYKQFLKDFKEELEKEIKPKKKKEKYPSMRCFNCGQVFKLSCNPKESMSSIICPECHTPSYYAHFIPNWFLLEFYTNPEFSLVRDLIKAGKIELKTIIGNL